MKNYEAIYIIGILNAFWCVVFGAMAVTDINNLSGGNMFVVMLLLITFIVSAITIFYSADKLENN